MQCENSNASGFLSCFLCSFFFHLTVGSVFKHELSQPTMQKDPANTLSLTGQVSAYQVSAIY